MSTAASWNSALQTERQFCPAASAGALTSVTMDVTAGGGGGVRLPADDVDFAGGVGGVDGAGGVVGREGVTDGGNGVGDAVLAGVRDCVGG